jgi:arylsulfate sulfotransferase
MCLTALIIVGLAQSTALALSVTDIRLVKNPNATVPLAGILTFKTDVPAQAVISIDSGDQETVATPPNQNWETEHTLWVLGLRPGKTNKVSLKLSDQSGASIETEVGEIVTDPLHDEFPKIELTMSRPRKMESGITIVPLFKWEGVAPVEDYGLALGLDSHGDVVWFYETDHNVTELIKTARGTFTYQVGRNGVMNEIDMLGNIVRRWHTTGVPKKNLHEDSIPVETDTFHHTHSMLPNGNFLMLSTEIRHFEEFPSSEGNPDAPKRPADVIGDVIIEFTPEGKTVREWKILDFFDPMRIGYGSLGTGFYAAVYKNVLKKPAKDWSHTNSIEYDAETDTAVMSSYHLDVVYKIDMKTGDLKWMLGTHDGWEEPWQKYLLTRTDPNMEWHYHQHSAKITPHGTIMMFDNGTNKAFPPEKKKPVEEQYSRAVEYKINEQTKEVTEVWAYGGPDEDLFFSPFISETDWLPIKENVLITDGGRMRGKDGKPSASIFGGHHWARILEVTHDTPADKVWEIIIDDPARGWAVFRADRIPSLYP